MSGQSGLTRIELDTRARLTIEMKTWKLITKRNHPGWRNRIELKQFPTIHQTGEDHNCWWHGSREHYMEEALSESRQQNLNSGKTGTAKVNKQNNTTATVRTQISRRTDRQTKQKKMNRFIAEDLKALHLSTWMQIRYPGIRNQSSPTDHTMAEMTPI